MRLLIRPDGSFDRRAVMLDAHRQFRLMKANGWSFARCLAFSSSKARAMAAQARPTGPERSLRRYLVQPSFEGVLAMHKIITGRPASPTEIEQLRASVIADGVLRD
jgi:hypothetical protein